MNLKTIQLQLASYCAYQDRSRKEITDKLREWEVAADKWEQVLAFLQKEKFWDEARFVRSYVGGKFRVKQWGRRKIRFEIAKHQVPESLVWDALDSEIAEDDYHQTIRELIAKKRKEAKGTPYQIRAKIANYLLQKGYEWAEFGEELGEEL